MYKGPVCSTLQTWHLAYNTCHMTKTLCLVSQLRAVACAVIVVIVRVLNIAVPLVYKRVVDTLSDATAGTHAEHGETPQTYSFRQVGSRRSS